MRQIKRSRILNLLNRRAIVFSMISTLMAVLFVLIFWSANSSRLDIDSPAINARVQVMNSFIASIDVYIDDVVGINLRGILTALPEYLATNHGSEVPLSLAEVEGNITSCLINGEAEAGAGLDSCSPVGENLSLYYSIGALQELASSDLSLTPIFIIQSSDFTVEDFAPFELELKFTVNMSLQDSFHFASWNRSKDHDIIFNVEGLPDPLFIWYGNETKNGGKILKEGARKRNITRFDTSLERINTSELDRLIAEGAYIAFLKGKPYLLRLAGDKSDAGDEDRGIQTFIDPDNLSDGGFTEEEKINLSYSAQQIFNKRIFSCSATEGGDEVFGFVPKYFNPNHNPNFKLNIPRITLFTNISPTNFTSSCSWVPAP